MGLALCLRVVVHVQYELHVRHAMHAQDRAQIIREGVQLRVARSRVRIRLQPMQRVVVDAEHGGDVVLSDAVVVLLRRFEGFTCDGPRLEGC